LVSSTPHPRPHKTQYARPKGDAPKGGLQCHEILLLGTGLVQGRLDEQSTAVVHLDDVSIARELSAAAFLDVHLAGVLGEAPPGTLEDLLASGKLEFSPTDGLDDVRLCVILGTNAQKDLTNVDTGGHTNGLTIGVTHSRRQPIGTGARKHLIGSQHMKWVGTDADVVSVLSDCFGKMLVDGNAGCLQSFARNLLLLVADQMGDKREEIDGGLLVTNIKDLDL